MAATTPPTLTADVEHGLRLVRAGGTVLIPRVLAAGAVADPVRRDAVTTAYRSLIQEVQASPAVFGALSTTGEGLLQLTTVARPLADIESVWAAKEPSGTRVVITP